jgi:1-pyrroline-5-carboxylate dehydrogenase
MQHHYARGSSQRAGLTAALEALQTKGALEVPLVVGGKEVRLPEAPLSSNAKHC